MYLKRFLHFWKNIYNKEKENQVSTNEWKVALLTHVLQKDGYNCGACITHYFSQIVNDRPLTTPYNMDKYRKKIRKLILHNSDPVHALCLYCGRTVATDKSIRCSYCNRRIHLKCLIFRSEDKDIKDCQICKLCQLYT